MTALLMLTVIVTGAPKMRGLPTALFNRNSNITALGPVMATRVSQDFWIPRLQSVMLQIYGKRIPILGKRIGTRRTLKVILFTIFTDMGSKEHSKI